MQASTKRHINSGHEFDTLLPQSVKKDKVVVGNNAKLKDTLVLIQQVIKDSLEDTKELAKKLRGYNIKKTCKNIWNFVYTHIQYKMDATGIEQVRRPSRTWADRHTGVDCDCYTVFIGSILANLHIPFKMRVTKYGGRKNFQHIYPIVPTSHGHITIDCVANRFNQEVPYSEKQDIVLDQNNISIQGLAGISGVDTADISLDALKQRPIALREIIPQQKIQCFTPTQKQIPTELSPKKGKTASPFRFDDQHKNKTIKPKKEFNLLEFLLISGISVAAGVGVIQLFNHKKPKRKTVRNRTKK